MRWIFLLKYLYHVKKSTEVLCFLKEIIRLVNGLKGRETEFRGERLLRRVRAIWFRVCCVQQLQGVVWKAKLQCPQKKAQEMGHSILTCGSLHVGLMWDPPYLTDFTVELLSWTRVLQSLIPRATGQKLIFWKSMCLPRTNIETLFLLEIQALENCCAFPGVFWKKKKKKWYPWTLSL